MPNTVTMKGSPLTVLGDLPAVGSAAPDFELTAIDLSAKTLADYAGKVKIISTVPSLDTSVCDTSTRKFNEEAASLSDDIVILTVSLDLPFAAKRWCGAAGIEAVECLSDYKHRSFAEAYGLLIDGLFVTARSVMVLDKDNKIVYQQLVGEIAEEPDYAAALEAAKAAV